MTIMVIQKKRGFFKVAGKKNYAYALSDTARAILAVDGLEHAHPGFVDRLICGESAEWGLGVLSCEKSFRRMPNAEVIP